MTEHLFLTPFDLYFHSFLDILRSTIIAAMEAIVFWSPEAFNAAEENKAFC